MKLYCIPHAGGSSTVFSGWRKYIDNSIELIPIELSGRGRRFKEAFYTNMNEAVEDVYNQISDDIEDDDFSLFGHSMGSLIVYELCHKILAINRKNPKHVFFSGYKAPHITRIEEKIHDLEDETLKEKILKIGGTPKEFFDYKELYDLYAPVLRADFKLVETYEYRDRRKKLPVDASVLNGNADDIKMNEILEWKNHIQGNCKVYMLEGDHFYINDNREKLVRIINQTLMESR